MELPKDLGGLGIANILQRNLALLFKWRWRFLKEGGPLWKRIVCSVHNIKGTKASSNIFKDLKDGVWGQFWGKDDKLVHFRGLVDEGIVNIVGNGVSISFWHDK